MLLCEKFNIEEPVYFKVDNFVFQTLSTHDLDMINMIDFGDILVLIYR